MIVSDNKKGSSTICKHESVTASYLAPSIELDDIKNGNPIYEVIISVTCDDCGLEGEISASGQATWS